MITAQWLAGFTRHLTTTDPHPGFCVSRAVPRIDGGKGRCQVEGG